MKKITLIIISAIFWSCQNEKNKIVGIYSSKNNTYTIDSLWINEDETYINKMFRKKDSSLIYKNTGTYKVEGKYVTFDNFFSDEDEEHSTEFTKYEDVLMTQKFEIETKDGIVIFHHKAMYDNIYLEKIH